MRLNPNSIALMKGYVLGNKHSSKIEDNRDVIASIQANIQKYGYLFSPELSNDLKKWSRRDLILLNKQVNDFMIDMFGEDGYRPFYNNFVDKMMEASDAELYINAVIHYLSNGQWTPEFESINSKFLAPKTTKYNVLSLLPKDEFVTIYRNLVSINSSLAPIDLEIVEWFLVNMDSDQLKVENVPFKETLVLLAAFGIDVPIKTVTDVLRLAVYMSGGDVSLPPLPPKMVSVPSGTLWRRTFTTIPNPERTKFLFKKFSRPARKMILSYLEKTNLDVREGKTRIEKWIKLGEIIHPGEYRNAYPKSFQFFDLLRNTKVKSWYGEVDSEFNRSLEQGLIKLSERGGEYFRRLDYLLRSNPYNQDKVLKYIPKASETVSNKVLIEVLGHFNSRLEHQNSRSILIKGSRKPYPLPVLQPLGSILVDKIKRMIEDCLIRKYCELESLGICYIDPQLKKAPIPTSMRNVSLTSRPVIRGLRVPFQGDFIRSYVHWVDEHGNEDLDLSATFVKSNGNTDLVSFSQLRLPSRNAYHSGDVRHVRGKCAEYLDLDIKGLCKEGYEFVIFDVRNYNGRPLSSVDAKAGITSLERISASAGSNWKPDNIEQAFTLASTSTGVIISAIDLKTSEFIIIDLDQEGIVTRGRGKEILEMIDKLVKPPLLSMYDILYMNVLARGEEVTTPEEADVVFSFDEFTQTYEKIFQFV